MFVHGKYFYGNEISEYGQEHGYVDYRTLAKAFDAVLNNDIMQKTWDVVGYWEQESGFVDNSEEIEEIKERIEELEEQVENLAEESHEYDRGSMEFCDILAKSEELNKQIAELESKVEELEEEQEDYQEIYQYYIVSDNGARLLEEINEIVFYNEELDMYVWGVQHYGTSWDYVLTDIKCNVPYEDEAEE